MIGIAHSRSAADCRQAAFGRSSYAASYQRRSNGELRSALEKLWPYNRREASSDADTGRTDHSTIPAYSRNLPLRRWVSYSDYSFSLLASLSVTVAG